MCVLGIDWEILSSYGAEEGVGWRFTAPDSTWQNGCSEPLLNSFKCSLIHSIGNHILSFTEIQTVAFEAANMLNECPIGRHTNLPEEGQYLCPNDLILGRAASRVPQGPFKEYVSDRYSYLNVNNLITNNQSGFRPGDSTTNQLLYLVNEIHQAFEDHKSLELRSVFLDISKAFDKVWHDGLIFKMKQNGIS